MRPMRAAVTTMACVAITTAGVCAHASPTSPQPPPSTSLQEPASPVTRSPSAASAAPTADTRQLAWLAGCWMQVRGDQQIEEHWMKPAGGTMLGMSRTVRAGKMIEFEFVQIKEAAGRLAYVAKPSGQAEAVFPMKVISAEAAVFEDLAHDFPQRIIYRRIGDAAIMARIEGELNGKARAIDYSYTRCP
jgi:Domain of unknown function (DUF6265)